MIEARQLPEIGQRVRLNYGPKNPNTWRYSGTVRAVVDQHIVVKLWLRHKGYYTYLIITPESWSILPYEVKV